MAQTPQSFGTAFAVAGFSFDPNLSPNNQSFSNAVLAVVTRLAQPIELAIQPFLPGGGTALGTSAFANPTNLVSGTATNGTSTLAMRSDAAPALDWAQSPTWTGNHVFNPASGIPLIVKIAGVNRFQVNGTTTSIQGQGPVAGALVDMTPDASTFTVTASGMTTSPTGTAVWARSGNLVVLFLPAVTGTSNANTFTFTGLPAAIQPARTQYISLPYSCTESGGVFSTNLESIQVTAGSGTITFLLSGSTTGWGSTLIKGLSTAIVICYLLN